MEVSIFVLEDATCHVRSLMTLNHQREAQPSHMEELLVNTQQQLASYVRYVSTSP